MSAKQRFIHLLSIQNIKLFKLLPNTRGTLLRPEIATLKLHSGRMSYLYFAVSATNVKFIVKISENIFLCRFYLDYFCVVLLDDAP